MSQTLNPPRQSVNIGNTTQPPLKPKMVPWSATFPGTSNFVYFVDFTPLVSAGVIDMVQTIWVDNSQNGSSLTILSLGTNQNLVIPPNSQMYMPIIAQTVSPQFQIISSGSASVKVYFMNVAMPAFVYDPNVSSSPPFAFNVDGELLVSDPDLDAIIVNGGLAINTTYTETDVSFTTTGASQIVSNANGSRQYFYVQCPSSLTGGIWLNKAGGSAGPNLTGCMFLAPGQTYETNFKAPANRISAYGASGTLCPAGVG